MARRRVMDWKKFSQWSKGKRWPVKVTFLSVLAAVDDFGMAQWSPATVAMLLLEEELNSRTISVRQVAAIMESFAGGHDPEIVTWEDNDRRYLAVRKHQEYQRVRLPGNADCPLPPPEILQKLSPATRGLITENLQKFTSASGGEITEPDGSPRARAARRIPTSPPSGSPVDLREGEDEEEGAVSVKPPALANQFLRGPFTDAYRTKFPDIKPGMVPIRWGADTNALGSAIQRGWTVERVTPLLPVYFASEDRVVRDNGYRAADFIRLLPGLEQARREGRTHGATGRTASIKRATAGSRDKDWHEV